jgi:hypothetical protein
MHWTRPAVIEVNMSAEIGAYQSDSGEFDDSPPVVIPERGPFVEPRSAEQVSSR